MANTTECPVIAVGRENKESFFKGRTEEVDDRASGDIVFVAVGVLDDQTDENGGHGTGEGEGLGDVARGGDRGVVYDLEIRVEVWLDGCVEDR